MRVAAVINDLKTLGTVCVTATAGAFTAPKTFNYSIHIDGCAVCGPYRFTNVATYLAVDDENDTGETDTATYSEHRRSLPAGMHPHPGLLEDAQQHLLGWCADR